MLVSFYLSADAAEGHLDTGNRKVDAAAAGVLPVLHWWLLTIYTEIYRNKTFIPVNWYSFLTCTTSLKGKYQHVRKMKKGKLTPHPMDQLLKRMNKGTFADPRSVSWSVHPPAAGPQFLSERNEPHWPQHRPLPPQTWGRKSLLERFVNDICNTLQALRGCRRFLNLHLTVRVSPASWLGRSISRVEEVGSRPGLTPKNSSSCSHSSCRRARGTSWRTAGLQEGEKSGETVETA